MPLHTPLYDLHQRKGAKMVEFAGYMMPLQYTDGIIKEHLWVRDHCGWFDISHMGQIALKGDNVLTRLQSLTHHRLENLLPGRHRYTFLLNEGGYILDDMIVCNNGGYIDIVINASRKHVDLAWLRKALPDIDIIACYETHALIALQGPKAAPVLKPFFDTQDLYFMEGKKATWQGMEYYISRTGYTGEDGFEIAGENSDILTLSEAILKDPEVKPIGLGARDSLRLEAALSLYGHELNDTLKPQDVKSIKGLIPEGRAPIREHTKLYDAHGHDIGYVTSGGFSPTRQHPIALGMIKKDVDSVFADLRGRKIACKITKIPFINTRYRRRP